MLSDEQLKEVAALLKMPEADLSAAIKSTEVVAVTIPKVNTFTDTELQTLKNAEYKNGKEKGVEMEIKETKEALGLDFQGKTMDGLLKAVQKKAVDEAGLKPDEQVNALKADLEKVQANYKQLEQQLQEKDSAVSSAITERNIFRSIPSLGEGAVGIDKVIGLMKLDGYEFKTEGTETVVYKGGEKVANNLSQPLAVKDVVSGYAKDNGLFKEPQQQQQGRGGGGSNPAPVFTKLSEVKAHYEGQGKSVNGKEFQNEVRELKKANPDFELST